MMNKTCNPSLVKPRRVDIDLIKTLSIFLVLWGHAIQYWHGSRYTYNDDPIYKFIYGFHMPLFATISGFLFWGTLQRYSVRDIVVRKFNKLMVPCLVWAILLPTGESLLEIVLTRAPLNLESMLCQILESTLGNFWFYKAILFANILCLVLYRLFKAKNSLLFVSALLIVLMPNSYPLNSIAYVYPFFVIGLVYKKTNRSLKTGKALLYILSIAYIMLVQLQSCFFKLIVNFIQDAWICYLLKYYYRFIMGIIGCVVIISVIKGLSSRINKINHYVTYISSITGDIYIVSSIFFVASVAIIDILKIDSGSGTYYWIWSDILLLFISALFLIVCICVINILQRYPKIQRWLIGI